jgi:hypothetical protein
VACEQIIQAWKSTANEQNTNLFRRGLKRALFQQNKRKEKRAMQTIARAMEIVDEGARKDTESAGALHGIRPNANPLEARAMRSTVLKTRSLSGLRDRTEQKRRAENLAMQKTIHRSIPSFDPSIDQPSLRPRSRESMICCRKIWRCRRRFIG